MGLYGDYYKKYYSDIKSKKSGPEYHSNRYIPGNTYHNDERSEWSFPILTNVFAKGYIVIFTVQTIVVLLLLLGAVAVKIYPANQKLQQAYKTAIYYMDNGVIEDDSVIESKAVEIFNEIKGVLSIDEKHELDVAKNYSLPVSLTGFSKHEVKENQLIFTMKKDEIIKPAYSGTVKSVETGDSTSVLIDHGNGYEIKYSGLNEVSLSKGDVVTTDNVIGKVASDNQNIFIEVFYMGSRLNPEKCFSLSEV